MREASGIKGPYGLIALLGEREFEVPTVTEQHNARPRAGLCRWVLTTHT